MNTQNRRLLEYLQTHQSITPLEAWTHLGIYRLSGRVFDLRHEGHLVTSKLVTVRNKWGEEARVASYTLLQPGEGVVA